MPKLSPVSLRVLILRLRKFGFEGPHQEGKHPYMTKGNLMVTIPNPHKKDISVDLLTRLLRQAEIEKEDWKDK